MYDAFLIDLDGTAYLGSECISQTVDFVKRCREKEIKILFLTNNASATQKEIYNKLSNMGYEIEQEEIFTSAIALSIKLENENIRPYLIGDKGLKDAFLKKRIDFYSELDFQKDVEKIKSINSIVMGYTNKITYSDLAIASIVLENDSAKFYVTNKDIILPTKIGRLPGNGSFVNLLEEVSNKKAVCVGKPESFIMDEALKLLNLKKDKVCMIGDNYKTDILAGINNGIDTIFVATGVNTLEEVEEEEKQPTYKVKDLSEFKI